ncbi:T9SS C-terminal target domain-containing protein [Hymenobacter lapidiphilus]|uniref:T9SS type A sorting domain-containing protein n=1 Tax=Hymenobacter sp. CCM 8763 TaxID=2303334 RepID=UPI000E356E1F|nr:T9SS type A sorting domain-containing protein [Hymenobacter sp. CCM 8763]RFP66338.1 T9SS C-terminal target domain-containing protein [Hymenobacter sp. CCM 8763]
MSTLYSFGTWRGSRLLVLLAALLLAAQTTSAASAPIYSSGGAEGTSFTQSCTTVVLLTTCFGSVSQAGQAADGNFNSAATINVPVGLLADNVKLRMDLALPAPKNYRAGVVVSRNGGLLNLASVNLVSRLRLRTFLNSVEQESVPVSADLIQAILGSGGDATRIEFVATKPFDQIELEAGSLVALGYSLNVFYAYAIDANVIDKTDGLVTRFENPSTDNYSTTVKDDNGITICVNSGVSNPQNTVDNDLTNFATFNALVGVSCPNTLQTQLEGPAPAGYVAGFVLGSGTLLNVSVLDKLRITTYQGDVKQEQASGRDLLQLELLPDGQSVVRFTTIKPFDRIELQRTSVVDLLNNLRVYYGFGVTPSTFRDQQPRLSSFANTANNFQVGGTAGLIRNPQLAADNDLTGNFATVSSLVEVLTAPRLKLRLNGPGKAGNLTGVRLGLGTGLVDVNVLSNIRIRTYSGANGGTLVETATGSSLLKLELLAGGQFEVAFLTTQDFDWVEVELATGVALLNDVRIFFAFAEDRPTGFPTIIVKPTGPLPVQLTAFGARASGLAVDVSWETATEVNSHYFEVERSAQAGRGFVAVGRQQAAGTSTGNQFYTLTDAAAAQLPAGLLYYRLRQVDLDGTETYSAVVAVTRRAPAGALVLYPNPAPAGSQLRIGGLSGLPEGGYELLLYSMQGALVSRQPLRNATEATVPNLGAGVYQAIVNDAAGRLVGRQRLVLTQDR